LQAVVREVDGSIRIHAQLNANTFIQLLAAGVETPPPLNAFLSFHTRRGVLQQITAPRTTGILQKIVKMIKR
jgi:hypothetical protein